MSGRAGRFDDRDDGKEHQHDHLEADENVLHLFAGGDAAAGDVGRDGQQRHGRDDVDGLVVGQLGDCLIVRDCAKELIPVLHTDGGQVGQHDDGGNHHAPSAHPADVRTECLGRPGERGSAVRCSRIQFSIGIGGEKHGNEAGDENGRHLQADRRHDQADARRERVPGCVR
ncbi:Uncharacterised protein [Mycobacteroides abscessus subsp. massiliense]|nr:Uncharacterised protein [Mycobacteroides abscessus subsp. massiliense]